MHLEVVSPILGFEAVKTFSWEKIDDFFSKLEAVGAKEIAFTLIDPTTIRSYDFMIPLFYKNLLEIEKNEDVAVLNIVIIQNPIENATINFLAPLIVNTKKNLLAQVALDSTKYPDFGIAEPIKGYLHA